MRADVMRVSPAIVAPRSSTDLTSMPSATSAVPPGIGDRRAVEAEIAAEPAAGQAHLACDLGTLERNPAARFQPVGLEAGKRGAVEEEVVDHRIAQHRHGIEAAVLEADVARDAGTLEIEHAGNPAAGDAHALFMRPVPFVAAQDEEAQERRADQPCRIVRLRTKPVAQPVELAHAEVGEDALLRRGERLQRIERATNGPAGRPDMHPSARSERYAEHVPHDQQQRPDDEQHHGVGQHQRDDGADAGVLHVFLREAHHHREVDVERRDDVHRAVAHAVGGEHQVRVAAQPHEQRDEDGRQDRPFGERAGQDDVDQRHHDDEQDDVARGADRHVLQEVGEVHRHHGGEVRPVEEGDEVRDHEQQEDHAREVAPGLGDQPDGGGGVLDGARAAAIGVADHQEQQADQHDQRAHEGRAGHDAAGHLVAQDAPGNGRRGEQQDDQPRSRGRRARRT